MSAAPVIATRELSKSYGDTLALAALDLEVPAGTIYGFLGPNGAGKSTTIRLLLGLIRPTGGSASVLGLDVVADRDEVHQRTGYLTGDFAPYRDLTAEQYLTWFSHLRGGVDRRSIDALADRFDLDLGRRVGTLSHGNRQKVGIVQACMHEPDLLVLDEPTQGLDPLMQQAFLALLREQRDVGRTVFLSSHVLGEVEEVADTVAIIRSGTLVTVTDIADLKARARRRVELTFADASAGAAEALRRVDGITDVAVEGRTVSLVVVGSMAEMVRVAAPHEVERIVSGELDLEGVFLQYYEEG